MSPEPAGGERPAPRFVARELHAILRCGVLAHGFVHVHCDARGLDRLVPFSCIGRGFCPSCGGRRMADTAAHLAERVLRARIDTDLDGVPDVRDQCSGTRRKKKVDLNGCSKSQR